MKRKYFLRGTGLGILITALVFILLGKQGMSDEEVIKRAEELGYVKAEEVPVPTIDIEELREKEITPVPTAEPEGTEIPSPTGQPVGDTMEPSVTPEAEITPETSADQETPDPSISPDATMVPEPTEPPEITDMPGQTGGEAQGEDKTVVQLMFEVKYGTSLTKICGQLEDEGIIDSASEFRKYLADNNMDYTIRAGLYNISSDMSYEELARVLRRKKN